MEKMKDQAIVCNIGHFDNEIQVDRLNKAPGVKKLNIKPQVDKYTFAKVQQHLPAGRRPVGQSGFAPPAILASSCPTRRFSNQVPGPTWIFGKTVETYQPEVYRLPKKLDEEVARLHLEKIGVKLTRLTKKQAEYLGVSPDGPYKADHYRY